MSSRFTRQFESLYRRIRDDIFAFCEALNFEPTWQQAEILTATEEASAGRGSNYIACKSGQGPGKTTVSAVIGLWRCIRNVDALTIVTAPTMRQCRDVWLVEARRRIAQADPAIARFFNVTKTKIEIANRPDWGVKLVTATKEENAQGYHQENMTVIAEEASGVPRELVTQFKGTLSNPDALFLMIGNPNQRDCSFFDCFNSMRHRWATFTMNAEDTARDYPHIVSPQRNIDLADEFGTDSDVYRVRVLGEFPYADPNCVISSEDLEKCIGDSAHILRCAQIPRDEDYGGGLAKQFGIDLARFGSDESIIYRRSGQAIVERRRYAHTDPNDVIDEAFRMQTDAGWRNDRCWFVCDAGGMGQGCMANFHRAGKQIVEFHNGSKATEVDYANKVSQAWFHFARKARKGDTSIPKDNQLIQQLCSRQYFTDRHGRLILETKDEYLKRGHEQSPDRADACVMCFWDEVEAIGHAVGAGSGKSVGVVVR